MRSRDCRWPRSDSGAGRSVCAGCSTARKGCGTPLDAGSRVRSRSAPAPAPDSPASAPCSTRAPPCSAPDGSRACAATRPCRAAHPLARDQIPVHPHVPRVRQASRAGQHPAPLEQVRVMLDPLARRDTDDGFAPVSDDQLSLLRVSLLRPAQENRRGGFSA